MHVSGIHFYATRNTINNSRILYNCPLPYTTAIVAAIGRLVIAGGSSHALTLNKFIFIAFHGIHFPQSVLSVHGGAWSNTTGEKKAKKNEEK